MVLCVPCKKEMTCEKVGAVAHFGNGHCYSGDIYRCKTCGQSAMTTAPGNWQAPDVEGLRNKTIVIDVT